MKKRCDQGGGMKGVSPRPSKKTDLRFFHNKRASGPSSRPQSFADEYPYLSASTAIYVASLVFVPFVRENYRRIDIKKEKKRKREK